MQMPTFAILDLGTWIGFHTSYLTVRTHSSQDLLGAGFYATHVYIRVNM
jgi:hypothetical protein